MTRRLWLFGVACLALSLGVDAQDRLRFLDAGGGGGGAFTFASGYSGTVTTTHNATQTINVASGFGTKSTAAPQKYSDFSSGTHGASLSTEFTIDSSGSNVPTYSSTLVRHARNTLSGRANFPNPEYMSQFGVASQSWVTSGVFVDAWMYLDLDGNQGAGDYPRNIKPFWVNGAAGNPSVFFPAFWDPDVASGGILDQNGAAAPNDGTNESTFYIASVDANYFLDQWRHVRLWAVQSTSDGLNGTFHLTVDNSVKVNTTTAGSRFASGGNAAWNSMYIGGYLGHDFLGGQGGPYALDARIYYSDVYIDSSPARLEVCDHATYASATHCEIQVPITWSNTQITFTLKQGSFSSFPGLSLFYFTAAAPTTAVLVGTYTSGGGTGITFDSGFDGTGTFSEGQTVTITRSAGSWGTKPNAAKPLYYYPLETNLTPDATYSRTTTNPSSWAAESSFTTAILAPNAAGSARMDLTCPVVGGGNCVMGPNDGIVFTGTQTYVYTRRYFPSPLDPAGFNLKFPRFWPVTTTGPNFYEGHEGASGADGAPRYSTEVCPDPPGGESDFGGHGFREDQWMVDEYEAQQASADDVRDGEFHHIRNGTYAFPRASKRWITRCNSSAAQTRVYGEQHSNNVTASPWYTYWDLHIVDDSWCRVMVSAESTWNITGSVDTSNPGTEVTREYQPATSWATTAITFRVTRGTLALSGKYLWVIGGAGCTTATRIGQFT